MNKKYQKLRNHEKKTKIAKKSNNHEQKIPKIQI